MGFDASLKVHVFRGLQVRPLSEDELNSSNCYSRAADEAAFQTLLVRKCGFTPEYASKFEYVLCETISYGVGFVEEEAAPSAYIVLRATHTVLKAPDLRQLDFGPFGYGVAQHALAAATIGDGNADDTYIGDAQQLVNVVHKLLCLDKELTKEWPVLTMATVVDVC